MLFAVWTTDIIRPTRDLDLLSFGDSDVEAVRRALVDILGVDAPDDGMTFDLETVKAEPIRAEQLYEGIPVTALAFIGSARIPVQIDIGFGDAITPGLKDEDYPTLLDAPAPRLKVYPRETVIAEKFESLVGAIPSVCRALARCLWPPDLRRRPRHHRPTRRHALKRRGFYWRGWACYQERISAGRVGARNFSALWQSAWKNRLPQPDPGIRP